MLSRLPSPFPKRLVVFGTLLLVAAIACNLPYEYQDTARLPALHRPSYEVMQDEAEAPTLVIAGFPKSFYVRTDLPEHSTTPNISAFALLQNITLWGGLLLGVFWYELYLSGRKPGRSERPKRSISLMDLLLVLGVVAAGLAQWRNLDARYEETRKLASLIGSQRGEARSVVLLPRGVAKWLPNFITKRCLQIRNVRLENPGKEVLDQVLRQPLLQQLRIGGGEIDSSVTSRIGQLPVLWDLRLSGTQLQPIDIANLSNVADRLVALNLMRTNITWQGIDALGEMPRLKYLGLSHTNCRLADLERPEWSSTVQELVLPHPAPGHADSLEIDSWPALRRLAILEFDEVKNPTPVSVTLRNMQKLDEVLLDPLQNFSLAIHDCNVRRVDLFNAQLKARARNDTDVPGTLYLSDIEIRNTPNLAELSVFGPELKSYHISDAPKLNFGIGTFFYEQPSQMEAWRYQAVRYPRELPPEIPLAIRQGWLDQLATCDGPATVDFSAIPLSGCNLAPIAANAGLRRIDLSQTGVSDELQNLKSDSLSELLLQDLPIDDALLNKLIDQIPNLERIEISPDQVQQLQLHDKAQLRSIFASGNEIMLNAFAIDLRNLPEFQETIIAPRLLSKCRIVNTPKLRGITINYPLPEDSKLTGFENLRTFAAGGLKVDDGVFAEIARCKEMESLLLSHASISRDAFLSLSSLTGLKHLCLYGCDVDDAVVQEIGKLTNLESLTLDYTQVTSASAAALSQLQQLKVLSIDDTPLAKGDLSFLPQLAKLVELRIGGATLDLELIATLKQLEALRALELTGGRLTKEGVNELVTNKPLRIRRLGLRDIKQPTFDASDLLPLNSELDITGAEFLPASIDALHASYRIADFRFLPYAMAPLRDNLMAVPSDLAKFSFHPEVFRPGYEFLPSASPRDVVLKSTGWANSYYAESGASDYSITITPSPIAPTPSVSSSGAVDSFFFWLGYGIGELQRSTSAPNDAGERYEEF